MIPAVCLAVVDPRILILAFVYPRCPAAKLLTLFAFGRVCSNAAGFPSEELGGMRDYVHQHGGSVYRRAPALSERSIEDERRRKALMEDAFELVVPNDFCMVTSQPLLTELVDLAQHWQGRGYAHVLPDMVLTHINRHTFATVEEFGRAPDYLGQGRMSQHDYLIHTAMLGDADTLITNDGLLLLPGDAHHESPTTGHKVHPYSLADFIRSLPHNLDLNVIDPLRVFRAATDPLSREPA